MENRETNEIFLYWGEQYLLNPRDGVVAFDRSYQRLLSTEAAFLQKPFGLRELAAAVSRAMDAAKTLRD